MRRRGERREHSKRNREPTDTQRARRTLRDIFSRGNDPQVQQWIDQTPSTGHMEGDSGRMVREIDNWPDAWMPNASPARARLKDAIAADPDEAYVYYPIGHNRPVIWYGDRRWDLDEFQQAYG